MYVQFKKEKKTRSKSRAIKRKAKTERNKGGRKTKGEKKDGIHDSDGGYQYRRNETKVKTTIIKNNTV